MNSSFNQIIATSGDKGLYPADQEVFLGDGVWGPSPGEIVIWDPATNLSKDKSAIGVIDNLRIGFGQGPANGRSECVVTIGSDDFQICRDGIEVDFTKPCCGQAQQTDILLGCIECEKPYSVDIYMKNPWTQAYYGHEGEVVFEYEVATSCQTDCGEGDCDPSIDCFCLAQQLADKINEGRGTVTIPGSKIELNNEDAFYQPFWAVAISSDCKVYHACLGFEEEGDCCESCAYLPGITSLTVPVKVGEGSEDCVIDLSKFSPNEKTYPAQMRALAKFINKTLHKSGVHAQVTRGMGKCCKYKITIAGCVAAAPTLAGGGDPTFKEECPFQPYEIEKACKGCNGGPETRTPCSKVRIFMDDIEVACKCGTPAGLVDEFGKNSSFEYTNLENRITDIQFRESRGLGNESGSWKKGYFGFEEVVPQIESEGYGYEYFKKRESFQHAGGQGGFRYYGGGIVDHKYGNIWMSGGFQNDGIFGNLKCDETYCAMNICLLKTAWRPHQNATNHRQLQYSIILVPIGDENTHNTLLEIFECLGAIDKCNVIGEGCLSEDGEPCLCTDCDAQVDAQIAVEEAVETDVHGEPVEPVPVAPIPAQDAEQSAGLEVAKKAVEDQEKVVTRIKGDLTKAQGKVEVAQAKADGEKDAAKKKKLVGKVAPLAEKVTALEAEVKHAEDDLASKQSALDALNVPA